MCASMNAACPRTGKVCYPTGAYFGGGVHQPVADAVTNDSCKYRVKAAGVFYTCGLLVSP